MLYWKQFAALLVALTVASSATVYSIYWFNAEVIPKEWKLLTTGMTRDQAYKILNYSYQGEVKKEGWSRAYATSDSNWSPRLSRKRAYIWIRFSNGDSMYEKTGMEALINRMNDNIVAIEFKFEPEVAFTPWPHRIKN